MSLRSVRSEKVCDGKVEGLEMEELSGERDVRCVNQWPHQSKQ